MRPTVLLTLLVSACSSVETGSVVPPAPAALDDELKTTSATLALDNLAAQVRSAESLQADPTRGSDARVRLVSLLLVRGQILGRIGDWERAESLADANVRRAPRDPAALVARASVRSMFHRFTEALADLDSAEKLGVSKEETAWERAVVAQALGDLSLAEQLRAPLVKIRPTTRGLLTLASLAAERGDLAGAEAMFVAARAKFLDVSPFPLAGLELQEGLMYERAGSLSKARASYEAAHARLPQHAAVASHLAAVWSATGDTPKAEAVLRELVASGTDDPEYTAQLADLLARTHREAEAAPLRTQAISRYEEILKAHPAAYAAHGARFYLGVGDNRARAAALAELALSNRPVDESWELVLSSLPANGDPQHACARASEALAARPAACPRLRLQAAALFQGCNNRERAQAETDRAMHPAPVARR